jgi:hypothetical protein
VTRSQTASTGNAPWHSFGNRGNGSIVAARGTSSFGGNSQWHSFGNSRNGFDAAGRGSSSIARDDHFHSFGNRGSAIGSTARGETNSFRGGEGSFDGNSRGAPANAAGWNTFSRGSANAGTSHRGLSNLDRGFAGTTSHAGGTAISANRVMANIEGNRFNNFTGNRFGVSQFGMTDSRFGGPEFGDRRGFGGGPFFDSGPSFGADLFSFLPNLLNLASAAGSFGVRGFAPIGLGLNLLGSVLSDVGSYDNGGYGYGDYGIYAPPACQLVHVWNPIPFFYPYPSETLVCNP